MNELVLGVVGLPLLAGALGALAQLRARPSTAHRVATAGTGLTALCVLALLSYAGDTPTVLVEWLPGTGPMGLTLGASGLYPVLVTTCGAFLVLLGAISRGIELRPLSGTVMLLALAAANIAFLADHFLARYVALEIVALCVALALLIEVRNSARVRLTWTSYLLLRVGDVGLLVAILILRDASQTLSIGPALELARSSIEGTGPALSGARQGWLVAGFLLAVWIKLGGWPFHLWSQMGGRLSLASQAWLYATVVPNLGMYLLYRVTPLLPLIGSLQTAALWLGAGGAALAALIALTQPEPRSALVYVGAAQAGLALFVAAAGLKSAVWVGILVLTPVRLLLFLASGAAQNAGSAKWRKVNASLFGLGGLVLTAFSLLVTWWAREASVALDALFVAQSAVALTAVWAVQAAWRLSRPLPGAGKGAVVHWTQWTVVLLGGGVFAGGLASGSLVRHLITAGGVTLPAFPALLRYALTAPALLAVLVLSLGAWRLQRRSGQNPLVVVESVEEPYDLEEGLARAAQVLRAVVEVGIVERIVALVVRTVVCGAQAASAVEHRGLEGTINRSARAVVNGAHVAHRVVEQGGLEGILRRAVRIIMALSRVLQRGHTGLMRRNLLWVPIALALAVLTLVVLGW